MSSGRRNTIEGLEQQPSVATSPSADVPATPPSVLLPFVRLHTCHPEPSGAPVALPEEDVDAAMDRPDGNKKFRLAVRGHYFVVLSDESGSRRELQQVDLIGLEISNRSGREGVAPVIALKRIKELKPTKPAGEPPASAQVLLRSRTLMKVEEPSPDPPMAWLLVAEGGEECLHRAIFSLAGAGALRVDFDAAYAKEDGIVGSGSFGSVHKAWVRNSKGEKDKHADPVVAKCVESSAFVEARPSKSEPDSGPIPKMLRSEMSFMLTAKGHPHVLQLHAVFRQPETSQWILVMDLCAGGDAFTHISKTGVQSEASCKILLDGLLSALSHLGSLQIIHRDVKPENLLLQTGGRPVLCDFGLACGASDGEETRRRVGSAGYIAPEVLQGSRCTDKADVFSAGATLHFAMAGSPPFVGKDMASTLHKTMNEQVYYESATFSRLSSECKEFAQLLLSKTTGERPSALEALHHPWIGRTPPVPSRPATSATPRGGARRAMTMTVKSNKLAVSELGLAPKKPSAQTLTNSATRGSSCEMEESPPRAMSRSSKKAHTRNMGDRVKGG
ncbi:unnamed protein product [Effrenium voratum]|nr:unnamed protein product [Effrenium voratum]CAJ1444528.1 unnamed protein product [Effrenium voratum]